MALLTRAWSCMRGLVQHMPAGQGCSEAQKETLTLISPIQPAPQQGLNSRPIGAGLPHVRVSCCWWDCLNRLQHCAW